MLKWVPAVLLVGFILGREAPKLPLEERIDSIRFESYHRKAVRECTGRDIIKEATLAEAECWTFKTVEWCKAHANFKNCKRWLE